MPAAGFATSTARMCWSWAAAAWPLTAPISKKRSGSRSSNRPKLPWQWRSAAFASAGVEARRENRVMDSTVANDHGQHVTGILEPSRTIRRGAAVAGLGACGEGGCVVETDRHQRD